MPKLYFYSQLNSTVLFDKVIYSIRFLLHFIISLTAWKIKSPSISCVEQIINDVLSVTNISDLCSDHGACVSVRASDLRRLFCRHPLLCLGLPSVRSQGLPGPLQWQALPLHWVLRQGLRPQQRACAGIYTHLLHRHHLHLNWSVGLTLYLSCLFRSLGNVLGIVPRPQSQSKLCWFVYKWLPKSNQNSAVEGRDLRSTHSYMRNILLLFFLRSGQAFFFTLLCQFS